MGFAGLVRRLFPQEAETALSAPDVRTRVERFANLFGERHFPLYAPMIEFWTDSDDEPPWSWLRRGIPFELMGFGYDGPDGLRVAWLESAAERIPQETLQRVPEGGISPEDLTTALKDTRFEGAALAASWVLAETGNWFLDHNYEDGSYDGFCDPWDDDIIAEGTEEWRRANALMDAVCKLSDWLEEDLPARFAEMLDFTLARIPEQEKGKEDNDDEQ